MWNDKVIHMCGYHPLAVFVYYMLLFGGLTLFGNPYLYASVLISGIMLRPCFLHHEMQSSMCLNPEGRKNPSSLMMIS